MTTAFEALLTVELRYAISTERTILQSKLVAPPDTSNHGEIISYLHALELLEYYLNNPEAPWRSSAWKVLVGCDPVVPGVKAVLKYLLFSGYRVTDASMVFHGSLFRGKELNFPKATYMTLGPSSFAPLNGIQVTLHDTKWHSSDTK